MSKLRPALRGNIWRSGLMSFIVSTSLTGCFLSSGDTDSSKTAATDTTLTPSAENSWSSNHAPEVTSLLLAVDANNDHLVSLSAQDQDGDELSWTIVSQPVNGQLSGYAPHLTYTPNNGFSGSDSFQVRVSDGKLSSETTTITLVVRKINDVPVAHDQNITLEKDTTGEISLTAYDADGDLLTFVLETLPQHGKLMGSVPHFTYEPDPGYEGPDSFAFIVEDGMDISEQATVELMIHYPQRPINDTGIVFGANYPTENNDSCIGETVEAQDCSHGRDFKAVNNDEGIDPDENGHAGFDFVKLDESGNALPSAALTWSCVLDKTTGLMWEVKTEADELTGTISLHDADDTYNWYSDDSTNNNGNLGYDDDNGATCFGYDEAVESTFCNTQAFIARVNEQGLCGFSDWRMPDRGELDGLQNLNAQEVLIDKNYFPATLANNYWTSTPSSTSTSYSYVLGFHDGIATYKSRRETYPVRLVRSNWK